MLARYIGDEPDQSGNGPCQALATGDERRCISNLNGQMQMKKYCFVNSLTSKLDLPTEPA